HCAAEANTVTAIQTCPESSLPLIFASTERSPPPLCALLSWSNRRRRSPSAGRFAVSGLHHFHHAPVPVRLLAVAEVAVQGCESPGRIDHHGRHADDYAEGLDRAVVTAELDEGLAQGERRRGEEVQEPRGVQGVLGGLFGAVLAEHRAGEAKVRLLAVGID